MTKTEIENNNINILRLNIEGSGAPVFIDVKSLLSKSMQTITRSQVVNGQDTIITTAVCPDSKNPVCG